MVDEEKKKKKMRETRVFRWNGRERPDKRLLIGNARRRKKSRENAGNVTLSHSSSVITRYPLFRDATVVVVHLFLPHVIVVTDCSSSSFLFLLLFLLSLFSLPADHGNQEGWREERERENEK